MRRGATSHDVWSLHAERRSFARSPPAASTATPSTDATHPSLPDRLRPPAPSQSRRLPARRNRWRRLQRRGRQVGRLLRPLLRERAGSACRGFRRSRRSRRCRRMYAASPPPARRGVGARTRSASSATAADQPRGGPVRVAGTLRFRSISAGGTFTCGVALDGTPYCWGSRRVGGAGADGTGAV